MYRTHLYTTGMLQVGQELLAGARIVSISGHLRCLLTIATNHGLYQIEATPAGVDVPAALETGGYGWAWSSDDATNEQLGYALCVAAAEQINPAEVARTVKASASGKSRDVAGGRILTSAGSGRERFWALEPYVGCLVGCRFCYAQSRLQAWRTALQLPVATWGTWVDAREDAAAALRKDLAELEDLPIKFTPVRADPYQAIEAKLKRTRDCLSVLAELPPRATIVLTRCALIERDLELIASVPRAFVGVSMPTMDDQVRRHFEPKAAATHQRFDTLRKASALGIETFAVVQPMLPGKSERLADLLAANVDSVSLDVLHGVHGAREDFADPGVEKAADPGWQQDRLMEMAELLTDRNVPLWKGELPPKARRVAT